MAYPAWPSSLPDPEAPYDGDFVLPLQQGDPESIGALKSARDRTRPVKRGNVSLFLEAADYWTFYTFWRDTLYEGVSKFTADWITTLGYPGYVARILTPSTGLVGVQPLITLKLELIPDVRLDGSDISPWPSP